MTLFFAEQLNAQGGLLGPEESHHASRVLRMSEGDEFLVTRGEGVIYRARFRQLAKKQALFTVEGTERQEERSSYLHIAMAPTKSNDRFENFLEKATEAGIDEITPLITQHSERLQYKTARGHKVIQAAAKQSLACWWPKLNEPVAFQQFIKGEWAANTHRYIAYCGDGPKHEVLAQLATQSDSLFLIGPEGDFSPEEASQALEHGFKLASLGPKRLRTETAGMAVAFAHKLLR